jgi:3-deoxy-manno-octulosonate cytidylyltransferase (CMP-KDO synthetase)
MMNKKRRTMGVIPARFASSRFEGKVIALIAGKPMIQHVWQRAKQCQLLDDVIIACDDERVMKVAQSFNAHVVMTSVHHQSGSDRLREVIQDLSADVVVNIQGDEPLINPLIIDTLVRVLHDDPTCPMATVIKKINHLEEIHNPNVVKVVVDHHGYALYFSRATIPFNRDQQSVTYLKHLGLYAYQKDFLLQFPTLPTSSLENIERLEQLRVLEAGYKIKTILTDQETIGVDHPEDIQKVEALLLS